MASNASQRLGEATVRPQHSFLVCRNGRIARAAAWLAQGARKHFKHSDGAIRPFRNSKKRLLQRQRGLPKGLGRVLSIRCGMPKKIAAAAAWLAQGAGKNLKPCRCYPFVLVLLAVEQRMQTQRVTLEMPRQSR